MTTRQAAMTFLASTFSVRAGDARVVDELLARPELYEKLAKRIGVYPNSEPDCMEGPKLMDAMCVLHDHFEEGV